MIESPPTLHGVGGLVVITGGEGGLGRALHVAFENAGHAVLSPGHRELDVTDPEAVRGFFRVHEPELLVCNAGITRDAPLARLDEAAWDEVIAVNLRGAARCAAAASRSMLRARRGHIVFISSFSAIHPPPRPGRLRRRQSRPHRPLEEPRPRARPRWHPGEYDPPRLPRHPHDCGTFRRPP